MAIAKDVSAVWDKDELHVDANDGKSYTYKAKGGKLSCPPDDGVHVQCSQFRELCLSLGAGGKPRLRRDADGLLPTICVQVDEQGATAWLGGDGWYLFELVP
jgi:hypothetical protein